MAPWSVAASSSPTRGGPCGSQRPCIEPWAALLADAAMYGSALRQPPYQLRYELLEFREGAGRRGATVTARGDGTGIAP